MTRRDALTTTPLDWPRAIRIIPSRFPPISLFERVADAADLEAVYAIEALTNERLRAEVGQLSLVPQEERVSGPGTGFIMAAFTHVRPDGARFNDGTFGAFYAAADRATAIAETRHHSARFHRDAGHGPLRLDMRVLRAHVRAEVLELRGRRETIPDVYHPDDYAASQALAREAYARKLGGIVYESVRRAGGECVAALRPRCVLRCTQAEHLEYFFDGERIAQVYEKRRVRD